MPNAVARRSRAPRLAAPSRWLMALLVLCWALGLPEPAQAQEPAAQRFADALIADDIGEDRFPTRAVWRVVSLPDDWSESRPHVRAPAWYRLRFDAVGVRDRNQLLGLLIERVCGNVEVQLNGQRLFAAGRTTDPISQDCERPRLVALPAALLEDRGNALDLRVAGYSLEQVASRQRAAGLSAPLVGPFAELHARHERLTLMKSTLPQVASAALLLMGTVVFVMGWWHRRESHLAYFGGLCIGWSLITARLWWPGIGLPNYDTELLLVALVPLVALCAVQFLLHFANRRSRPIEVALLAQSAIVPASLLLAGPMRVNMIASSWYVMLAVQVLVAMAFYLHITWRERRRDFWPMLVVLAGIGVMVGVELAGQQALLSDNLRVLPHVAIPLGFLGLGVWLVQQYGQALQTAEDLRASLEVRVREATAVMERSYAQMAETRVEQVTQQERKRIAADLHDDLGAKLLTIVHTSDDRAHLDPGARGAGRDAPVRARPHRQAGEADRRAGRLARRGGDAPAQTGVEGEWQAPCRRVAADAVVARLCADHAHPARGGQQHHQAQRRVAMLVRCTISSGDFQLVIQDNGKGIPLELDGRLDRGHGMSSMKHRAKQLQGQCLVESGPGYGTVIRLTIPLEKHTTAGPEPGVRPVAQCKDTP
jgi:two-component system sensor histidine kinase UhpB